MHNLSCWLSKSQWGRLCFLPKGLVNFQSANIHLYGAHASVCVRRVRASSWLSRAAQICTVFCIEKFLSLSAQVFYAPACFLYGRQFLASDKVQIEFLPILRSKLPMHRSNTRSKSTQLLSQNSREMVITIFTAKSPIDENFWSFLKNNTSPQLQSSWKVLDTHSLRGPVFWPSEQGFKALFRGWFEHAFDLEC